MFAPGLAMLWEGTDPTAALQERFGLTDLEAAASWVSSTLHSAWAVPVTTVERVLISDVNALAWVRSDHGAFVVKVCSFAAGFERLEAIASLLGELDTEGLPVAAPVADREGKRRHVAETDRPLSVAVHPLVDGDLLDAGDLTAVSATGTMVGRLHHALAERDTTPFANGPREISGSLREHIVSGLDRLSNVKAPRAHARLIHLLEELPDLDTPPQLGHGDIRGANVLVRGQQVAAVLDFDEVSIRHRTVEISLGAILLATEFRRWSPAPQAAQQALLAGYQSVVELTDVEHAWTEALRLWFGLTQIPAGPDPAGWADAVEHSA